MYANGFGQSGAAAVSVTAVFPGAVVAGDKLVIAISSDAYNAYPDLFGWSKSTELNASGVGGVFYTKDAVGGEKSQVVSGLTSNEYTWHTAVIPGVLSVGTAVPSPSGGNYNNRTSLGLTTPGANTLILTLIPHDGARYITLESPCMLINRSDSYSSSNSPVHGATLVYQFEKDNAVATSGIEYGISAAVNSGVLELPLVLDPDYVPPYVIDMPVTFVHPLNTSSYISEYGGAEDFEATIIGTVDGYSTVANVASIEEGEATPSGSNNGVRARQTGGANRNTLVSGTIQITEGDYSGGKVLSFNYKLNTFPAFASYAEGSAYIGLRSDEGGLSNGPWRRIWKMPSAGASPDGQELINICIDPENTDYVYDDGAGSAFEPDKIDGIVLMMYRNVRDIAFDVSYLYELGTLKMAGGSVNIPLTFESFSEAMETYESLSFRTAAVKQYAHEINWQVGDGGIHPVYFEEAGANLKGPTQNNEDTGEVSYRAATMPTGKFHLGSGDTCLLTDSLIGGGTEGGIDFEIAAGATVSYRGTIISTKLPTFTQLQAGNLANITLRACASIPTGNDLANVTIDQTTSVNGALVLTGSTEAAVNLELDTIGAVALTNNTIGPALRLVNSGVADPSMSLASPDGMTWSGNTVDVHLDAANDTVLTLTMGEGGNASTTATSGGGANSVSIIIPINFVVEGLPNGDPYWCWNLTDGELVASGTGDGNDFNIPFSAIGKSIVFRAGHDQSSRFEQAFTTGSINIPIGIAFATDPFRAVNDVTALAYSGIAVSGDTSIDYTGTRTIQEVLDYCCAWGNSAAGLPYDIPQSTADGTTILLSTSYSHDVDGGNVKQESKEWSGTFTVSGGGFFEHRLGAIWEAAGSNYYATHFYINVRSNADESDTEAAVIAFVETDSDTDVTYSTGLVNGGVLTDVNGDAEGYAVYRIGATTYSGFKELIGEYSFDWFDVPVALNGSPIGSSSNKNVVRLVPDSNVGLSKAAGLAVVGITANHSSKLANINGKTNTEAHDNLKARQARPEQIDTGIPGYMSFYQVGLILENDGSFFNALSDWTFENLGGSGVWKGGTINLDTPGVIALDVNGVTFDYETDGTYTHSANELQGTITVDTTNNSTVTAVVGAGKTISNSDPANITVDESENFISTIKIAVPDEYAAASISNSVYRVLYVDGAGGADIDTENAVTVNDANDAAVVGNSSDVLGTAGSYYIEFDYAYDNNDQAGLTAQTDKSVVLRMAAVGRRFKELPFVITRNALINQTAEMLEDFNAAAA